MAIYKQFVDLSRESGFSILSTRTGYRIERWSTKPGDRTGVVWYVPEVVAKRVNPDAGSRWGFPAVLGYGTRAMDLVRYCQAKLSGVSVVSDGYEVR